MPYTYKIVKPDQSKVTGVGFTTLQTVIDHIEFHAFGKTLRNVYINDIYLEDVGLHLSEGKVVEEDGQPIVCRNKWYDLFAKLPESNTSLSEQESLDRVHQDVHEENRRMFRPQPTRGNAPTNPATPAVKDKL